MAQLSEFLLAHGWMLACGVSALLVCGALVAALVRSVVLRQRVCELCVLGAMVWLVLASVPMPRVGWTVEAGGVEPLIRVERSAPVRVVEIPPEIIAKPQAVTAVAAPRSLEIADPVEVKKAIDWRDLSARGFLAGALICVGWLMLGRIVLWRMIRGSVAAPEGVVRMVEALSRRNMGGPPMPPVWITPGLSRPVTCGVWRPVILLPESLLAAECRGQLRQVLLHELGHVHQGDGWGNLLFCVALPVLYWHPVYWWLRRCASLSRELVADDWAARADGKEAYVSELVALARTRMGGIAGPVGAIGILQSRSDFYRRMHMLLQRRNQLATGCSRTCRAAMGTMTLAVVMGMVAMVGVRPARGQAEVPGAAEAPVARDADHVIGPNDLLNITLSDVAGAGVESVKNTRVSESGTIRLPLIGTVKVLGLTEAGLEQAISQRYRDMNLIQNAPVSVAVIEMHRGAAPGAATPAARASSGAAPSADAGRDTARAAIDHFTDVQIGMTDPRMRKLLDEREAFDAQLAALRAKGLAAEHPEMKLVGSRRAEADTKIKEYAREWRDLQSKMAEGSRISGASPNPAGREGAGARGQVMVSDAGIGGVQLDLVNLANTIVDAAGAVRVAKVNVSARQKLAKDNGFTNMELATEEANLQTAAKRLELLKGIASIALEGASAEFERSNQRFQQGLEGQREVLEAQSKMRMLQLIVKSAE